LDFAIQEDSIFKNNENHDTKIWEIQKKHHKGTWVNCKNWFGFRGRSWRGCKQSFKGERGWGLLNRFLYIIVFFGMCGSFYLLVVNIENLNIALLLVAPIIVVIHHFLKF